jgi:anionic cell wall polymer biosynthesis LytR-Cps2A-Psr (LCP) family protein
MVQTATAIKTVESYLNIPIDFYALVNMSGLEKMVTQVGGNFC